MSIWFSSDRPAPALAGSPAGYKAVNSAREKVFLPGRFPCLLLSVPVRDAGFRFLRLENKTNEYVVLSATMDGS